MSGSPLLTQQLPFWSPRPGQQFALLLLSPLFGPMHVHLLPFDWPLQQLLLSPMSGPPVATQQVLF
jgi:hypothetical protein